jgi:hypothetical protein
VVILVTVPGDSGRSTRIDQRRSNVASGKKYDIRIIPTESGYTARFIRRRTQKGTVVEKEAGGFADQRAAESWANEALRAYVAARKRRSKNRSANRAVRRRNERAIDDWLKSLSYKELAEITTQEHEHAAAALQKLKSDAVSLWEEVAFRVMKNGGTQQVAVSLANEEVGKTWGQRFEKALAGKLDHMTEGVKQIAIDNAKRILAMGRKMDRSE